MDHDGLTIDYIHDGPMISPQLWDDDINYGTMMIFIMAYNLVHYVPNYDIYDGIFQVPKSFFFLKSIFGRHVYLGDSVMSFPEIPRTVDLLNNDQEN